MNLKYTTDEKNEIDYLSIMIVRAKFEWRKATDKRTKQKSIDDTLKELYQFASKANKQDVINIANHYLDLVYPNFDDAEANKLHEKRLEYILGENKE